jgi:hypothetical protein
VNVASHLFLLRLAVRIHGLGKLAIGDDCKQRSTHVDLVRISPPTEEVEVMLPHKATYQIGLLIAGRCKSIPILRRVNKTFDHVTRVASYLSSFMCGRFMAARTPSMRLARQMIDKAIGSKHPLCDKMADPNTKRSSAVINRLLSFTKKPFKILSIIPANCEFWSNVQYEANVSM